MITWFLDSNSPVPTMTSDTAQEEDDYRRDLYQHWFCWRFYNFNSLFCFGKVDYKILNSHTQGLHASIEAGTLEFLLSKEGYTLGYRLQC